MKETDILTTPEQIRTWEEIQSRNPEKKIIAFCFHDGVNVAKSNGTQVDSQSIKLTHKEEEGSTGIYRLIEFVQSSFADLTIADAFIKAKAVHPSIFAIIFHDFMTFTNWYNDIEEEEFYDFKDFYTVEEFIEAHPHRWFLPYQETTEHLEPKTIILNPSFWMGLQIKHDNKNVVVTSVKKSEEDGVWKITLTPEKVTESIGMGKGKDIKIKVTALNQDNH